MLSIKSNNIKEQRHVQEHTLIACAGTYTPICLLALHGDLGRKLLIMVWSGAGFGFLQSLFFVTLAKKATAFLYLALGWMAAQYGKVGFVSKIIVSKSIGFDYQAE